LVVTEVSRERSVFIFKAKKYKSHRLNFGGGEGLTPSIFFFNLILLWLLSSRGANKNIGVKLKERGEVSMSD